MAVQAAEAREAAALEEEAQSFAGLEEKSGWPLGEGTGCRVLEKWVLEDLRQQILQPPESQGQEETPAEVGPEGESDVLEEPKFADGTEALDTLAFDNDWFEENLSSLRSAIFENLIGQKRYLDRVDIPAACEEVRRDLDQRLRRHTNRKGEVQAGGGRGRPLAHACDCLRLELRVSGVPQVDWYVPRYSTVSKHKDAASCATTFSNSNTRGKSR